MDKSSKCPAGKPWAVIKDSDGSVVACHQTKKGALKQLAALNIAEPSAGGESMAVIPATTRAFPRDNLYRAFVDGVEMREEERAGEAAAPVLAGHFAVFDRWTEIDSLFEGRFLERIAPGAFRKTFKENREHIRVLFQHGRDPVVGDKPLGPIEVLREDEDGAYYEVPLLQTGYNDDLLPGLRAGLYGASFRFRVIKEDIDEEPGQSDENPDGLPERTIKEAQVFEFGPVTFPAYTDASAAVRSLTDRFRDDVEEPQLRLADGTPNESTGEREVTVTLSPGLEVTTSNSTGVSATITTTVDAGAEETHSDAALSEPEPDESVHSVPSGSREVGFRTDDNGGSTMAETAFTSEAEVYSRLDEIKFRLEEIDRVNGVNRLPETEEREFKDLLAERKELEALLEEIAWRKQGVRSTAEKPEARESEREVRTLNPDRGSRLPENLHALEEYRTKARSQDEQRQLLRDGALKIMSETSIPHERADARKVETHLERLLARDSRDSEIARRIITTSSPAYRRAFGKVIAGQALSAEEQRAMSLTDNKGGYAVPATLDPTIILTSDGQINPIRQIARVETIAGSDTWKGVSSAGVAASYATEAAEAADADPTFAGPEITPVRAHCWIPFSYEVGMDWVGLEGELARLLQDAKDVLEAEKFITGTGSNEPEGVVYGLGAAYHVTSGTVNGFEVADIYRVKDALPPRFRARAAWLANDSFYSEIRQLDTYGGGALWAQLGEGRPTLLIGKPAYEASDMASTSVAGDEVLLYGDFSHYVIVDRVGMSIELVPQVFGSNHLPTGQRGFYSFWRNSAEIVADQAFRVLTIGLTS